VRCLLTNILLKYHALFSETERQIESRLRSVSELVLANQARVLSAFQELRIDETCFFDSTGYGYHDIGREKLDMLYALVFGGEAGLVRPHFVSGTHAIASCLFGILRPGNRLVSLTGRPYDTLHRALGLTAGAHDGLSSLGINYSEADLRYGLSDRELDRVLTSDTRVVLLQRSRGYTERRSLTTEDIEALVQAVKRRLPDAVVFVDNCYGEFVEQREPCHVGADLIAGSLIKNPGGGLAPSGGYVVGRSDLVEQAARHMTAPGLGCAIGCMTGVKRLYYQGLFMAPHQTGEALKGAILAAALFSRLGYQVNPAWDEVRGDIVQAIRLEDPDLLRKFCRAVQRASPVDSYVIPQPAAMVGYTDEIIMAAGTFIQGASSEFSADAPLRSPYTVFVQGGLTFEHAKLALAGILDDLWPEKAHNGTGIS
jgi:cystathionine beta-lyase family protein involved in aluminum resistance